MPLVTIGGNNFPLAVGRQPVDKIIDQASKKAVVEAEIYCPTEKRPTAGRFLQVVTKEGPFGWATFADNARPPATQFEEGYNRQYRFTNWGVQLAIGKFDMEDLVKRGDDYGAALEINRMVRDLKRAIEESQELRAYGALSNAHQTYTYENLITPDGQQLYSTSHSYVNRSGTESNKAAAWAAVAKATIATARYNFNNIKDAQGRLLSYKNLLLILGPKTASDQNIYELFASEGDITNAANRDANPIAVRKWGDINLKEIRHFTSADANWYFAIADEGRAPLKRVIRSAMQTLTEYDPIAQVRVYACVERDAIVPGDWADTYGTIA